MQFIDDQTFPDTKKQQCEYKMQQNVLRANNGRVLPYIIKFAHVQLMGSVVCYLRSCSEDMHIVWIILCYSFHKLNISHFYNQSV